MLAPVNNFSNNTVQPLQKTPVRFAAQNDPFKPDMQKEIKHGYWASSAFGIAAGATGIMGYLTDSLPLFEVSKILGGSTLLMWVVTKVTDHIFKPGNEPTQN